MRNKISPEDWNQIKTAYASGLGLREIARNMNIPQGHRAGQGKAGRLDTANSTSKTGRCFDAIKCNHPIAINRGSDAGARRTLP